MARCCFVVVMFASFIGHGIADEPAYLKNIDYLGKGYDLARGDPHANSVDPGFKAGGQIVNMNSYHKKQLTPDHRFKRPDNTEAQQTLDCSFSSNSFEVFGAKSMYDSFREDVKVEGGGLGWSFSASTDYQKVKASCNQYHRAYVSTVAKCEIYTAALEPGKTPELRSGFRNMVKSLPTSANPHDPSNPYWKFIQTFGTHYTKSVSFGSKAVLRSEFDEVSWAKMSSFHLDVKAAAHFSFFGNHGGAKMETDKEKKEAEAFESKRSSFSENFLGARPSKDGKKESWLREAGAEPMPFAYKLGSIGELLTKTLFPHDSGIHSKHTVWKQHLNAYCGRVHGCRDHPLDPAPIGFEQQKNQQTETGTIQCSPGKVALSCGMNLHCSSETFSSLLGRRRRRPQPPPTPYWQVLPSSSDACQCSLHGSDSGCDTCHATCVDKPITHVTTVKVDGTGTLTASCPHGSRVTGCGIANGQAESFPNVYPSSETSCTCYNNGGATCYATCASHVSKWQALNEYGTDDVTVKCPEDTFALGCGMRNKVEESDSLTLSSGRRRRRPAADQYEKNPGYYPTDLQTCTCYNHYGTTCYAICGVITNGTSSSVTMVV